MQNIKLSRNSHLQILIRSIVISLGMLSALTLCATAQKIEIIPTPTTEMGSTGTTITPNLTTNTIDIQGGKTSGDSKNLFHSFGKFNVNTDQVANFQTTDTKIQNILGTVTGGASMINGGIQVNGGSTTSTVNLFLMNPAGIVFGKGASLDINGAFTATTAKAIDFSGKWFNAVGTNTYQELNGNPIGFAFPDSTPGSTPGSIFSAATFDGSPLDPTDPARLKQTTKPGQSITLVGGTVISTGDIKTAGGNISIATVEGGKYVEIKDGGILRLYLPASAPDITSEAKAFTALSLPQLLTATGVNLEATGVKNEGGVVTLVGDPAAIKAAADRDNAQAIVDASNKNKPFGATSEEFAAVSASEKALEAVTAVGDSRTISADINLGDTVSKQNRSISSGDVITRNLDTSNINKNGGNIHIRSSQAILSGQIDTSYNYSDSPDPVNPIKIGGTVILDAQTELKTKSIDSSVVFAGKTSNGGNVTLSTQTKDIIVDSINTNAGFTEDVKLIGDGATKLTKAESEGRIGGNVTINAAGLFRVITDGGISSSLFGVIDITHGSKQPFASGVTFEPKQGAEGPIPKPGFTFPDGASGSRGAIVTSRSTNGSVSTVFKDQPIDGISIKVKLDPPIVSVENDLNKNSNGGKIDTDVATKTSTDDSGEQDSTKDNSATYSDSQASNSSDSEEDKQKAKKRKQKAKCKNNSSAIASAKLGTEVNRAGNIANSAAEEFCPPNSSGILQILTDRK